MKVVPGCQELLATLQVVPDNSLTLKNSPLSQIMNVEDMLLLQIMILIIGLGLMEIVTLVI